MTRRSNNSVMCTKVLHQRYLMKNARGEIIEVPEQMFHRVANAIVASESRYGATDNEQKAIAVEFCELMIEGVFLPNSPTLMNSQKNLRRSFKNMLIRRVQNSRKSEVAFPIGKEAFGTPSIIDR